MITSKGNWTVCGINMIPSDSIYQDLQKAISSGNLSERYLQKLTGTCLPIDVNFETSTITFGKF